MMDDPPESPPDEALDVSRRTLLGCISVGGTLASIPGLSIGGSDSVGGEHGNPVSVTAGGHQSTASPTGSFREIAEFLDPVETATTLRDLSEDHRWTPDEDRFSFRAMVRRHTHPDRRDQRFLFLNTFLMDWGPGSVIGTKPRVDARAREIGQYIRDHELDIAALAEVWRTDEMRSVLDQFTTKPQHVDHVADRIAGDLGKREERAAGSAGLLTLSADVPIVADRFDEYRHEYTNVGEQTLDGRADKGVLLAVLDEGLGPSRLLIYNTHLQAGNKQVALKQALQLATFIRETKSERDLALVAGDFNIDADGTDSYSTSEIADVEFDVPEILRRAVLEQVEDGVPTGERVARKTAHSMLIHLFSVLGFTDAWATRNGAPGFTSNVDSPAVTEVTCRPDPRDERWCADDDESGKTDDAARIDYLFVSRPSLRQSFRLDITRPRRPRTVRPPAAPGRDEIVFLSDHLGLRTTLRLSPA